MKDYTVKSKQFLLDLLSMKMFCFYLVSGFLQQTFFEETHDH